MHGRERRLPGVRVLEARRRIAGVGVADQRRIVGCRGDGQRLGERLGCDGGRAPERGAEQGASRADGRVGGHGSSQVVWPPPSGHADRARAPVPPSPPTCGGWVAAPATGASWRRPPELAAPASLRLAEPREGVVRRRRRSSPRAVRAERETRPAGARSRPGVRAAGRRGLRGRALASPPTVGRGCRRACRRRGRGGGGRQVWDAAVGSVAAAEPSVASRRIADRALDDPARSRAANSPSDRLRPRRDTPAAHAIVTQRRPSASSRRPSETRRSAMSSGHSSSARTSSQGHRSVNWLVVCRSWIQGSAGGVQLAPPVADRIAAEQRLVRPEEPVLGRASAPRGRASARAATRRARVCVTRTAYAPLSSVLDRCLVDARARPGEGDRRRRQVRADSATLVV